MKYRIICYLICLFSWGSLSAKAFVIGVEKLSYLPYYSMDRDGEYVGFARELFDAFEKESGYNLLLRPYPSKRLFKEFVGGFIDAKFPDNPHWRAFERLNKDIYYSEKVVKFTDGVVIKRGNMDKIQKISIVRGFTPWTLLENHTEYKFVNTNSIESAIKMVLNDRTDGVYGNINVIKRHEKLMNGKMSDKLYTYQSVPTDNSYYYLASATGSELIKAFNDFINSTNHLNILLDKYNLN